MVPEPLVDVCGFDCGQLCCREGGQPHLSEDGRCGVCVAAGAHAAGLGGDGVEALCALGWGHPRRARPLQLPHHVYQPALPHLRRNISLLSPTEYGEITYIFLWTLGPK